MIQLTTKINLKYANIAMALAGVFQAASLVNDIAMHGKTDERDFATCIQSIFKIDAADVAAVYGGKENLKTGLKEIIRVFARKKHGKADPHISRYALCAILLQHKLQGDRGRLDKIRDRILQAGKQVEYFTPTHSAVLANLADIYITSISTFNLRVQLLGKPVHVKNQDNLNKMRALLLAAVRSAVLFHQVGGRRWQLFFARQQIRRAAEMILMSIEKI